MRLCSGRTQGLSLKCPLIYSIKGNFDEPLALRGAVLDLGEHVELGLRKGVVGWEMRPGN